MKSYRLRSGCNSYRDSWVPATSPGEGSANLYTEQYEAKAAYEALRTDLELAAGVRRRS